MCMTYDMEQDLNCFDYNLVHSNACMLVCACLYMFKKTSAYHSVLTRFDTSKNLY